MLAERKKRRKKKGERKKRRKRKERKKKERKIIERKRVTVPINSHFVQGQTLGVGGAPKIIYERTLIAECSRVCRQPCSTPFGGFVSYHCPGSKICYPYRSPPTLISIPNFYFYRK
jgi:hypothetical protein